MPRGGYREKAGRPSTWKSGCKFSETKLIRVPTAIADQLLEIAHKLDSGESLDLVTIPNQGCLPHVFSEDVNLSRNELIEQGKAIVYDKDIVAQRDRTSVRKALGVLLGVEYEVFKK